MEKKGVVKTTHVRSVCSRVLGNNCCRKEILTFSGNEIDLKNVTVFGYVTVFGNTTVFGSSTVFGNVAV